MNRDNNTPRSLRHRVIDEYDEQWAEDEIERALNERYSPRHENDPLAQDQPGSSD